MTSKFQGITSDTTTQCALACHRYLKQDRPTNLAHSWLQITIVQVILLYMSVYFTFSLDCPLMHPLRNPECTVLRLSEWWSLL